MTTCVENAGANDGVDGEDRARSAISALPSKVLESIFEGLELHTGRRLRGLHAVLGDRVVREEPPHESCSSRG